MRARDAVLDYQKTMADTAVYEKDLDLQDPISALWLEVQSTNGATSNKGNFISDIVTKIEVVDGSEVLASLNQFELEALQFYKTGLMPGIFPSAWASGVQRHGAYLLFGQYLWDPLFAFDPSMFKNPQLKISFNKAAIRAASATGFASGDNIKISAVAKVMENMAGRPGRYLMPKSINRWTSSTSGERRIELPTDYPYRMMMLRSYVELSDINECITDLKLTCDTDKFIPFNRKVAELDAEALALFGVGRCKHDIFLSDDETEKLVFNKEPDCRLWYVDSALADIIGIEYQWSSQIKADLYTHAGAADSTDRKITMVEEGHSPHATLPITFGPLGDEGSWFKPNEYGKVELVVTEAVAATCGILLEQVRPNAKVG